MDSNSDDESDKCNINSSTSANILPEKSRRKYEDMYKYFINWQNIENCNSFSENVLLVFFKELSKKYAASSLWAKYSMLKSTLELNNGINIEKYTKLRSFLKCQSKSHQPKKSYIFSTNEIQKFINEAPDAVFLATKVACIMGVMGACRSNEMYLMKLVDCQVLGETMLVTVPNTKNKSVRKFAITDKYYQILKKYINLRPKTTSYPSLFLNYQKGKCFNQKIGINKFSNMGKQIAKFLDLPNPELYTGHCFRRTSAKLLVDSGANNTPLKRHGVWKSISVAESMKNKMSTAKALYNSVESSTKNKELLNLNTIPPINFYNCTNFTINIVTNQNDN